MNCCTTLFIAFTIVVGIIVHSVAANNIDGYRDPLYTRPTVQPSQRSWPSGDPNHGYTMPSGLRTIAVATISTPANAKDDRVNWLGRMSYNNKVEYCKRWGYDLIIEDQSIVDKSKTAHWSKMRLIKKYLPKYRWVLWMDMDAFFMRFDRPLEDFLDEDYDFVLQKDWNDINSGVWFMRNSPYTFKLMDDIWNSPKSYHGIHQEQSALQALFATRKAGAQTAKRNKDHTKFMPIRELQAYPSFLTILHPDMVYRSGDFIAHFPACGMFGGLCRPLVTRYYNKMLLDNDVEPLPDDFQIPNRLVPDY